MLILYQTLQGNEFYKDYDYYYFYTEEDCDRQCTFCNMYYNSSADQYYYEGDKFFCSNTPGLTDEETVLVAVLVPFGIFVIICAITIGCSVHQRNKRLNQITQTQVTTTKTVVSQQSPQTNTVQTVQVIQPPIAQYQQSQQIIYTQQPQQQTIQIQPQVVTLPPLQQQQVYYQPSQQVVQPQYPQQDMTNPPVL